MSFTSLLFRGTGRLNRKPFWGIWIPIAVVANILAETVKEIKPNLPTVIIFLVVMITFAWILLALSIKRLHDVDMRGSWVLLNVIPVIGSIVLLIIYVIDGTKGPNRFGVDPLGRTSETGAA